MAPIASSCIFAGDRYVYFDDRALDPNNYPPIEYAAAALAHVPRFSGHTLRPYSVLEHSLLVAAIGARKFGDRFKGNDVERDAFGLACLTHDIHEAFVGDMATPLKRALGTAWSELESRVEHGVRRAYRVSGIGDEYAEQVKVCDLIALATEKDQLLPAAVKPLDWGVLGDIEPDLSFDLYEGLTSPMDITHEFLNLYRHLFRSAGAYVDSIQPVKEAA